MLNWQTIKVALAPWGHRVQILADFINLAAQIAALVRRHAADAAIHLGVAASFLHRPALLFRACLVAAGIELANVASARLARRLGLRLGLIVTRRVLLMLLWRRLIAALTTRTILAFGMRQAGAQHAA